MPSNKPLLIFDGDCGFCRRWARRWKRVTGDTIDYAPFQSVSKDFPSVPPEEFRKAVQFIEPDGRRTSAAEAVLLSLRYAGFPVWSWAYRMAPGFAALSEFVYGVVSGHRPAFSFIARALWKESE
jgi:predicted DCC family thiol-disulfide oxidoreductase YuxK